MEDYRIGFLGSLVKHAIYVAVLCTVTLVGALVGTIIGAIKGQRSELGFFFGAGVGAFAGSITSIDLVESVADGEPILSKVALLSSLVNGKIFGEWVGSAMLKAYQSQISAFETSYRAISDIYDTDEFRGIPKERIQKIPECTFKSSDIVTRCQDDFCSICLEDFKDGDSMRKLPNCGHYFHLNCIDSWLALDASCPICRDYLCGHDMF